MKSKSFLGGTVILVGANIISKAFGALLKIPLTYILGEEGMAVYHTTFSIYITILFLVTSGVPFAVSRYISSEIAVSKTCNIKKVVNLSLLIMMILGIIGSLILYFGADFFAYALKDPNAVLSIRAIAPSILFVAIGCIYKSVFEASSNMIPTAISQVIESFFKLLLGFYLAMWLSSFSVKYATFGAVLSITIGELIATFILYILYIPYSITLKNDAADASCKYILKTIMSIAVPMMLTGVISSGLSLLDTTIIRNSLMHISFSKEAAIKFINSYSPYTDIFNNIINTLTMSLDGARWLFGAYSGYALTVFNLPVGILASFSVSVIPIITRCIVIKDFEGLNKVLSSVIKIILLISIPSSIIISVFPEYILSILFKNEASFLILKLMGPLLPIITISNILQSSLYADGKIGTSFINETISIIIKIPLSYALIRIPELNILGVVIASYISNSVYLLLNIVAVRKYLYFKGISYQFIIKALIASVATTVMFLILKTNLIKDNITFMVYTVLSVIIYSLICFLLNLIDKKEIKSLA